jgi:transposase-like protein
MRYTPPKFTDLKDMAAIDVGRLTEDGARAILENIRWPDGPVCPHCGSQDATRIESKSKNVRDGLLQCNACRRQFTVTVGTVMHRSHITLRQWVQAFYSMCSHKKGVSALQLQRNLGLHTYKSAWHLAHRIRYAMREDPFANLLNGTVEVDETYVGGKGHGKRGRSTEKKTPVVALVERGGRVRTKVTLDVSAKNLRSVLRKDISPKATVMTDEFTSYGKWLGREFAGHQTVNHRDKEYVKGEAHVNNCESFFALFKRGVHGTFHHISRRHLNRYCDEFGFRWDHRKATDGERTVAAIRQASGKRLVYQGRP